MFFLVKVFPYLHPNKWKIFAKKCVSMGQMEVAMNSNKNRLTLMKFENKEKKTKQIEWQFAQK